MNRRQFFGLSAASATAVAAGALALSGRGRLGASETTTRPRLAMPPLLDTRSAGKLSLTAKAGQSSFLGGPPTLTAGFNQGYLGPTIVMRTGPLAVDVANTLQEIVTVHWHGMLVPGHHDGSHHSPILPGRNWRVDMSLAQDPCTAWYHSHPHGATARQVYAGLAGVIHHTDGRDDERGLPSRYGVDDLTLIVQDRRFDDQGRMIYNPDPTDILNGFHGGRVLVNGQFNHIAAVPRGIVRLRLLNGSNARIYTLHFNDGRPLHVIATDGGFLPRPQELFYVRLAPGERVEVLVDFAQGPPPVMMSAAGLPMRILEFAHDERLAARIVRLPDMIAPELPPIPDGDMTTRRFNLNMGGSSKGEMPAKGGSHGGHAGHGGHGALIGSGARGETGILMTDFAINGRSYDMRRIDFNVPIGTYERWFIGGGAGVDHPFHVHGVHFRIVGAGGAPPRPENEGWKDTVVVGGESEIVVRFDHVAGKDAPYMYHCHILEHEDSGMMGQFTVT